MWLESYDLRIDDCNDPEDSYPISVFDINEQDVAYLNFTNSPLIRESSNDSGTPDDEWALSPNVHKRRNRTSDHTRGVLWWNAGRRRIKRRGR